jgi:hypothetical protein
LNPSLRVILAILISDPTEGLAILLTITSISYTYKDKIILFLYISNAIIIIIFIIGIFGKNKAIDTYFKRTYLLNWIPVKSVLVKRDGVMLSLPMILDYIILVKPDWEEKERKFMTQLNLNHNNNAIVMDIGANIGIYTILLSHISIQRLRL